MFNKFYTTLAGQQYIAKSMEDGKKLTLTKGVFGDGVKPSGYYPISATALIHKLGDMGLTVKETSATEVRITSQFTNRSGNGVMPGFNLTEMGICGKIQNSDGSDDASYPDTLLFYGISSVEESDYIPDTLTEFLINWSVAISGEATIEAVVDESLVYATHASVEKMVTDSLNGYIAVENPSHYSGPAGKYGIEIGKIRGRSVQAGTPTPDAPVEINSFGEGWVHFYSHGFQLFDASKLATKTQGGATVTNNGDGSFTVSGSGSLTETFGNYHYFNYSRQYALGLLKIGAIYFVSNNVYPRPFVQIKGTGGTLLELNHSNPSGIVTKEMLEDEGLHIAIGFYGATKNSILTGTVNPILYQDGDGTWEPYKEPQSVALAEPLRSLPNGACDTYESGKITRRIGVITLNGSETWNLFGSVFAVNIKTMKTPLSNDTNFGDVMCDKLPNVKYASLYNGAVSVGIGTHKNRLVGVSNGISSSLDEFKTWLASNPVTVLYELETPVIEEVGLTIPSWNPHTSVHHDSEIEPTLIEWRVKNQMAPIDPHPIGSVLVTSTNENPAVHLGGEWECFDKGLAWKAYDSEKQNLFWTPSSNTKVSYVYAAIHDHTAMFRFNITNNIPAGDDNITWGNVDFSKLGFSELSYSGIFMPGSSDGGEAIPISRLDYLTGELTTVDVNPKKDGETLPAGSQFYVHFTLPIATAAMDDNACDRFYWKRIR